MKLFTLVALPVVSAEKWGWTTAATENLCAGIITDCTDKTSCTAVGVGPCEGEKTTPDAYLKSTFVGVAFVKEATYLTNEADMDVKDPTGIGYRDFKGDMTIDADRKYAFTMTGNTFGDNHAYGGIASYLNIGKKEITTKYNDFFTVGTPSDTARKDRSSDSEPRSDSAIGAPHGPFKVCISQYDASATDKCGAARTFQPGAYKFSIFGHFMKTVDYGAHDHLGFRMRVTPVGFKADNLMVNGAAFDKAKINDDVTSISITHAKGGLSIDFPKDYNVGPTADADPTGEKVMTLTAGKKVGIKVHLDGSGGIFIDYLFEKEGLNEGQYFVYDPTVKEVPYKASEDSAAKNGNAPAPADAKGGSSVAAVGVAATALVATVLAVLL